ncbi:DEAD-box type RNA helicase, partial [Chytridiales sp. JEL 0842]
MLGMSNTQDNLMEQNATTVASDHDDDDDVMLLDDDEHEPRNVIELDGDPDVTTTPIPHQPPAIPIQPDEYRTTTITTAAAANTDTDIDDIPHFISTHQECPFHLHSLEVGVKLVGYWIGNDDELDSSGNPDAKKILQQSLRCHDCIFAYHDAKDAYIAQHAIPEEIQLLLDRFLNLDIARCIASFTELNHDILLPDRARECRRTFLVLASEIFNFPDVLKDPAVDQLFVTALLKLNQAKPLKLKTGLLRGSAILCFHSEDQVRDWACSNVLAIDPANYCSADEVMDVVSILKHVTARLTNGSEVMNHSSSDGFGNLTLETSRLWNGLATIFSVLFGDAIDVVAENIPELVDVALSYIKTSTDSSQFWNSLRCFHHLSESMKSRWWNYDEDSRLRGYLAIISSNTYRETLTSSFNGSSQDEGKSQWNAIEMTSNLCFIWMPTLFKLPGNPFWYRELILSLLAESYNWPITNKLKLAKAVIIPILTSLDSQSLLPKSFANTLILFTLQLPSLDPASESAFIRTMSDWIISDIDMIQTSYEAFYDRNSESLPSKLEFKSQAWQDAAITDIVARPKLVETLFAGFGRIALVDMLNTSTSESTSMEDDAKNFNKLLQQLWNTLEQMLDAFSNFDCRKNSVDVLTGTVFCTMCPSNQLSDVAWAFLCKALKTPRNEAVLTLSSSTELSYAQIMLETVESFRDHCSLGPPLFTSAFKILSILNQMWTSNPTSTRYNDTRYRTTEIWTKIWPFIDSVLSFSVKWAKQDITHRNDVKKIVGLAFNLTCRLLACKNILRSQREASFASVPVSGAMSSAGKWLRVLADDIREDAVRFEVKCVMYAKEANIKLTEVAVESLKKYCTGVEKSHMNETQKSNILLAINKYEESRIFAGNRPSIESQTQMKRKASMEFEPIVEKLVKNTLVHRSSESGHSNPTSASQMRKDGKVINSIFANQDKPRPQPPPTETKQSDSQKLIDQIKALPNKLTRPNVPSSTISRTLPQSIKSFSQASKIPIKPLGKKPPPKSSKIAQMRYEHHLEVKRTSIDLSSRKMAKSIQSRASDDDDDRTDLLSLAQAASSVRERKTAQLVDINANVIDKSKSRETIKQSKTSEGSKKLVWSKTINDFCEIILSWNLNTEGGDRPPNFDLQLEPIPDRFSSPSHYASVFEPFIILECWEQFKESKAELDLDAGIISSLSTFLMVDDFVDITLLSNLSSDKKNFFREGDIVCVEKVGSEDIRDRSRQSSGALAKVQST